MSTHTGQSASCSMKNNNNNTPKVVHKSLMEGEAEEFLPRGGLMRRHIVLVKCVSLWEYVIEETFQACLLKPVRAIFDMDHTGSAVGNFHAQLLLGTLRDPFCDTEEPQTELLWSQPFGHPLRKQLVLNCIFEHLGVHTTPSSKCEVPSCETLKMQDLGHSWRICNNSLFSTSWLTESPEPWS